MRETSTAWYKKRLATTTAVGWFWMTSFANDGPDKTEYGWIRSSALLTASDNKHSSLAYNPLAVLQRSVSGAIYCLLSSNHRGSYMFQRKLMSLNWIPFTWTYLLSRKSKKYYIGIIGDIFYTFACTYITRKNVISKSETWIAMIGVYSINNASDTIVHTNFVIVPKM